MTKNTMTKRKKRYTTIYKSLQRKLKIATHEPNKNQGMVYWSFDIKQGPTDELILTVRVKGNNLKIHINILMVLFCSRNTDITYLLSCVTARTARCRHTILKLSAKPMAIKQLHLNIIYYRISFICSST